jgi:opacity protein-like surface antigen
MKTNRKVLWSGVAGGALALLCAAMPAAAASREGRGFYIAGDVSMNKADVKQSQFDETVLGTFEDFGFDFVAGESDFDDSDIGYSVALGYSFSQRFAVEAAYIDLGDTTYSASGTFDDGEDLFDVNLGARVGSSGPAVSLVASLPLSNVWSLDARAGAYFAKTSITVEVGDETGSESRSGSDEHTGVLLGLGVTWSFGPKWALRAGYTHISDAVGESDVDQLSVGVKRSF